MLYFKGEVIQVPCSFMCDRWTIIALNMPRWVILYIPLLSSIFTFPMWSLSLSASLFRCLSHCLSSTPTVWSSLVPPHRIITPKRLKFAALSVSGISWCPILYSHRMYDPPLLVIEMLLCCVIDFIYNDFYINSTPENVCKPPKTVACGKLGRRG